MLQTTKRNRLETKSSTAPKLVSQLAVGLSGNPTDWMPRKLLGCSASWSPFWSAYWGVTGHLRLELGHRIGMHIALWFYLSKHFCSHTKNWKLVAGGLAVWPNNLNAKSNDTDWKLKAVPDQSLRVRRLSNYFLTQPI